MKRYKVAIDAGHGTFPNHRDPGAVGPSGLREADINKAVAAMVQQLLSPNFDIVMTRDETSEHVKNQNTDLWNRVRRANDAQVDLFVSIHCNAFNASANGIETFSYKTNTDGEKMAKILQKNLLQAIPLRNRGTKTANFYVLRKTDMPAVLTELAFISNPKEEAILADKNNHLKFAQAIAQSVAEYFSMSLSTSIIDTPIMSVPAPVETGDEDIEYLGEFEVTHYCECEKCCGKKPDHPQYGITASGRRVGEGRTVAVDTSIIPLGTKLKLKYPNGTEMNLIAEDKGSAIKQNKLDVYISSHERALKMGRVNGVRAYKTGFENVLMPPKETPARPPLPEYPTNEFETISVQKPTAVRPVVQRPRVQEGTVFKDVNPSMWGYQFIQKAKERGIIVGDNGYFYPEEPASRQALVTVNDKTIDYIFKKLRESGIDIRE